MLIRKLLQSDLDVYREIRAEMCQLHPAAFGQTPEEVIAMSDEMLLDWMAPCEHFPEKFVLGAYEGSDLVGTTGFRREEAAKECHRGFIWSVYVRPAVRRRGISRRLMQETLDAIRRIDGMEFVTLMVALPQTDARNLYASLGFVRIGLIQKGYKLSDGNYADIEEMMLRQ